jgi:hypothetical protein
MNSSISSSNSRKSGLGTRDRVSLQIPGMLLLLLLLLFLSGCAGAGHATVPGTGTVIAVLPVENSSGIQAPVGEIGRLLGEALRRSGVTLLDGESLRRFMEKRRLRYTGGIDAATAEEIRKETGATGILVTSLDLYAELPVPTVGLTSRLVMSESPAVVAWMDGAAVTGIDSPGVLGIGVVENAGRIAGDAAAGVAASLRRHLAGEEPKRPGAAHPPRVFHRGEDFRPPEGAKVAVIPFLNRSDRKYAGEMVALQLARGLAAEKGLRVVEPGEVRQKLLQYRVTLEEGVSLPTYSLIFDALDVDLVVTGEVTDFQDGAGLETAPKLAFSTIVFQRKEGRVVWSSSSSAEGDDGVYFFDCGKIATSHELAAKMTGAVVRGIMKR